MKKKWLGMLLVMLLTALTFAGHAAAAEPDWDVWDGVTVTEPTRTKTVDGEEYWQIFTCAELAYVTQTSDNDWRWANYSLEADLVINDTELLFDDAWNCINTAELNPWAPIKKLYGDFLGNGHTISGIYMPGNSWSVGFIGELYDGSVYDLKIINSYIENAQTYVGGICGSAEVYTNYDYD